MAYSTDSDLYERIDQELVIQLTDDDNTGSVDQTVLTDKRETCTELVDTHLRGQYDLPLSNPPKILADIEADILVDKLYQRRQIETPETVKDAHEQAMKLLHKISQGMIQLEDQPDPSDNNIQTNKDSDSRKFGTDTWDNY